MPIVMGEDKSNEPEKEEGSDDKPVVVKGAAKTSSMEGSPKQEHMYPFMSCCCTVPSCYCKFPDCIGCYGQGVFTCLELEILACKTGWNEGQSQQSLCSIVRGMRPFPTAQISTACAHIRRVVATPADGRGAP